MRTQLLPFVAPLGALLLACAPSRPSAAVTAVPDRRPIFAEAALPMVGSPVPAFDVERLGGGRVESAALHGRPVLLALWSTGCARSREAVAALDSLHRQFGRRGVRTVLLADDADSALIRTVLAQHGLVVAPPTALDTGIIVGLTRGTLTPLFDQSATARRDPALQAYRVQFVTPGFLLLDPTGRVRRRGAIILYHDTFAASLDSLLAPT